MDTKVETVGKIGSMALIDNETGDINYSRLSFISRQLKPGIIWVSSGATEIGRLCYRNRTGGELNGNADEIKTDYASEGQAVLMQLYRNFIDNKYGVRQLLVEHQHFNNKQKKEHLKNFLLRSVRDTSIPIINYNDAVSYEENRKMEINLIKNKGETPVELIDNDETASQIACLVKAKNLVILSTLDGIYKDVSDKGSLVEEISGNSFEETDNKIKEFQAFCKGASRAGAGGAYYKLEYIRPCLKNGTRIFIASAKYKLNDIIGGKVPCTRIFIK